MYKKTALLALCTVFSLSGCAAFYESLPPEVRFLIKWLEPKPKCMGLSKQDLPKWACYLPKAKIETGVYAYGTAGLGGSLDMRRDIAEENARKNILKAISSQVLSSFTRREGMRRALVNLQIEQNQTSSEPLTQNEEQLLDRLAAVSAEEITSIAATRAAGILSHTHVRETYFDPTEQTIYVLMEISNSENFKQADQDLIQGILDTLEISEDPIECPQNPCFDLSQKLVEAMAELENQ